MTYIFNKEEIKGLWRKLRNKMPKAEVVLWSKLKNKQLHGYKFRRQVSIGKYIIDFYCPQLKLAIEIDGATHAGQLIEEIDSDRQKVIESYGIRFIRFTNNDVYNNLDGVMYGIVQELPI